MAQMVQIPYDNPILVPIGTAQAVQIDIMNQPNDNPISLEALGLLTNLLSYPPTWELHKTELYKRYAKNKRTAVKSAWDDLEAARYIVEFKYRVGRKYDYVYFFRKVPFTEEEKAKILEDATKQYGEIWRLDFQQSKMDSPKHAGNQNLLLNKNPLLNNNIDNVENIDDDIRTTSLEVTEEMNIIISVFREETRGDLTDRSYKAVVRKVVDKYKQGKVGSFRDYLCTSLSNKIYDLELRRAKDQAKIELLGLKQECIEQQKNKLQNAPIREKVAFYNWLDA